ncbi:hypothetical protein [Halegenticoccus tardaugens]|uniref:hypothetical protein n=1 Tax=Halegenticoccus tardaugens TaxID=2071624 RepID=UPI00100B2264|nr:hypothetical protein [Halegenticoccus tardaugens]
MSNDSASTSTERGREQTHSQQQAAHNYTKLRRMILKSIGPEDEYIGAEFVPNYGLSDFALFLPAALLSAVVIRFANSTRGVIIWAAITLVLVGATLLFMFLAPSHSTPLKWTLSILKFKFGDKHMTLADDDNSPAELVNVTKLYPDDGAMKRRDWHLVAGVKVDPANMALASDADWDDMARDFERGLNGIEFPFQIHSSGRPIDPDEITAPYRSRLDDPDVKRNPRLKRIIKVYKSRLPGEFARRGTSLREYYVLVPVGTTEARLGDTGTRSKLANVDIPFVGRALEIIGLANYDMSNEEIEAEQLRILTNRINDIIQLISSLDGCRAEVLDAEELADAIEECWSGERTAYTKGDDTGRISYTPVVTLHRGDRDQCYAAQQEAAGEV